MRTVTCEEHGRLPHMGHLECPRCERVYRKAPADLCCGVALERACAKCAEPAMRAQAADMNPRDVSTSVGLYDEGPSGIDFVG